MGARGDTGHQEKSREPGELQETRRNLVSQERCRETGEIQGTRRDTWNKGRGDIENKEKYREPGDTGNKEKYREPREI